MNETRDQVRPSHRVLSAFLGLWLVVSAYAWPHAAGQMVNAILCGVLAMAAAVGGLYAPSLRYLNGALGLWLCLGALLDPSRSALTHYNNALCGVLLFASALTGHGGRELITRRAP